MTASLRYVWLVALLHLMGCRDRIEEVSEGRKQGLPTPETQPDRRAIGQTIIVTAKEQPLNKGANGEWLFERGIALRLESYEKDGPLRLAFSPRSASTEDWFQFYRALLVVKNDSPVRTRLDAVSVDFLSPEVAQAGRPFRNEWVASLPQIEPTRSQTFTAVGHFFSATDASDRVLHVRILADGIVAGTFVVQLPEHTNLAKDPSQSQTFASSQTGPDDDLSEHGTVEIPMATPLKSAGYRVSTRNQVPEDEMEEIWVPQPLKGKLFSGDATSGIADERLQIEILRFETGQMGSHLFYALRNFGSVPVRLARVEHIFYSRLPAYPAGGVPAQNYGRSVLPVRAARIRKSGATEEGFRLDPEERIEIRGSVGTSRFVYQVCVRIVYDDGTESVFAIFGIDKIRKPRV